MFEQVSVVQRPHAEVLEQPAAVPLDGVVELAAVLDNEAADGVVDEPEVVPRLHRLGERVDVLVLDLLVDEHREQPRRELRVLGLLRDERGRGADGELVELAGGGAVVEPGDGAGGDAERVHLMEAARRPFHRAHDLHDVGGLVRPAAFADPHRGRRLDAGVLRRRALRWRVRLVLGGCVGHQRPPTRPSARRARPVAEGLVPMQCSVPIRANLTPVKGNC